MNQQLIRWDTERLTIQEYKPSDLQEVHNLHLQVAVERYNTIGFPKTVADTKALLEPILAARSDPDRRQFLWTIRLRQTGAYLGELGLRLSSDKYASGEIYYNFDVNYWGQGYAQESCAALLEHAFIQMKLHRITAGVHVDNKRSIRLLERLQFQREGHHRKVLPIRGDWYDNYEYAILDEDYLDKFEEL